MVVINCIMGASLVNDEYFSRKNDAAIMAKDEGSLFSLCGK